MGDTTSERLRKLIDDAFAALDDNATPTAAVLRKAKRIASLRLDYVAEIRFTMDMTDISAGALLSVESFNNSRTSLAALVGSEEALKLHEKVYEQFQGARQTGSNGEIRGDSIEQIESLIVTLKSMHDDQDVPPNLGPLDTFYETQESRKTRADILKNIQNLNAVISRTRAFLHDYLIRAERELDMGQDKSDIFRRAQTSVNTALSTLAPAALDHFVAAQERLSEGTPEALSHAATSCRRGLKALADILYPATSEKVVGIDGAPRAMTDEKYRNRLTEFVRTNVEGRNHRETTIQAVNEIYKRLESLDALASKGVHDSISESEAESCIVWTYMLAGDLVRIADGTSPLVKNDG